MSKQDLGDIHKKLDKLGTQNEKILYFMGATEQHFKELNGSVRRHQEQFEIEERKLADICGAFDSKVSNIQKIALDNKGRLSKYGGIAIGLSLIITLAGFAVTLKALGVW